MNERSVGSGSDSLDEPGVVLRLRAFATAESKPEGDEKGAKLFRLLLRGTFVHPVQEEALVAGKKPRRGHVGRDHALFDQTMGVGAPPRFDCDDFPGFVEPDSGFRGIEVQSPAPAASAVEDTEERVQVTQMLRRNPEPDGSLTQTRGEHAGYFLIHEAGVRTHQGLSEARTQNATVPVDEHFAGDAEAILLPTQRAETV